MDQSVWIPEANPRPSRPTQWPALGLAPQLCFYSLTFRSFSSFGQVQCVKVPVGLCILLPWNRRVARIEKQSP